jgi:monoamine oxidase
MAALGLAGLGTGSLTGCSGQARESQAAQIAIIGGGIAGLTCAWRLRQAGVEAEVYDALPRLGGRILTDRTTFATQHCELGAEFINSDHLHMLRLATELGIELLDYQTDVKGLSEPDYFFGGRLLTGKELTAAFAPVAEAIELEHARLSHTEIDSAWKANPRAQELDRLSLAEWLAGIHAEDPIRTLIEVAFTAEFGLDPGQNNVLNMLLMISADAERLELLGDSDERFHASGGNQLFISRLVDRLDSGRLHTGHALESLASRPDGRYVLGFTRSAAATEVLATHVILALPFSILRTVRLDVDLPPVKRKAIDELGYGANTKLIAGLSARPWRAQHASGSIYTDLAFQTCWEASRLQPWDGGIVTSYTGGRPAIAMADGGTSERSAEFCHQLGQIFPGAAEAASGKSVRMAWHRQPFAKGSYSAYLTGQYTTIAGTEGVAVARLHFCGEHTCPEYQAYMEGGAQSGERVAGEILADLRLRRTEQEAKGR